MNLMTLQKIYKLVSPALVLALSLFAFPANTYATTIVTFTAVGTTSWTVPTHVTSVDYLVVAGGGGGAIAGGGAGGMRTGTLSVTPGASLTVTVGAGGNSRGNGSNSVFGSIISIGGGAGSDGGTGNTGGSGGGGGYTSQAGGAGTGGQGNNGGNGSANSGGGGGGAGAVGSNAPSASQGGNGGNGSASSISGSSVTYAGGGGGSGSSTGSSGGTGGGGAGSPSVGTAGTANTGGGGGGGEANGTGAAAAGGSGIVIISYTPKITITSSVTVTGDASVVGALSKGSGSFVIDHPLDPKNKLLYHSFVESPDVKNIYDGIAVLDEKGKATVELPGYFLALNKDFRYLLMPIGAPAPDIHISKEIRKKYWGLFGAPIFEIAGGRAGQEISWQVTGIRHDPLILKYPIKVEVEKGPGQLVNKGEYLFKDYPQYVR